MGSLTKHGCCGADFFLFPRFFFKSRLLLQVLTQDHLATVVTGVMVPAGAVTQPLLIPISIAGQVAGQQGLAVWTFPAATVAALPGLTAASPTGGVFKSPIAHLPGNPGLLQGPFLLVARASPKAPRLYEEPKLSWVWAKRAEVGKRQPNNQRNSLWQCREGHSWLLLRSRALCKRYEWPPLFPSQRNPLAHLLSPLKGMVAAHLCMLKRPVYASKPILIPGRTDCKIRRTRLLRQVFISHLTGIRGCCYLSCCLHYCALDSAAVQMVILLFGAFYCFNLGPLHIRFLSIHL